MEELWVEGEVSEMTISFPVNKVLVAMASVSKVQDVGHSESRSSINDPMSGRGVSWRAQTTGEEFEEEDVEHRMDP